MTRQRNRNLQFGNVKTNDNQLIKHQKNIEEVWLQYIHELFDVSKTVPNLEKQNELPLNILASEVNHALENIQEGIKINGLN